MYIVFFVSPSSCSSEESHVYSVTSESWSLWTSFFYVSWFSFLLLPPGVLVSRVRGEEGGLCYCWGSMYSFDLPYPFSSGGYV
jgi:hypothetical protein